ncbi:MAG: FAD:protein FMN transferase [Candidatus Omnitrophica bacterium]|nr:FAD:protein FMN transferase [Candidatus Omnitrophota bacterium]
MKDERCVFTSFVLRISSFVICCCLFFCSCGGQLHKDKFIVSGTYLEVISPYAAASEIVYDEFRRLDKIFNFYDSESQISWLNHTYNKPVNVSEELIEVLTIAKGINQATEGYFDVTLGALYSFWKNLIREGNIEELPSDVLVKNIQQQSGFNNIDIDSNNKRVTLKKEGLKIDLSAIAKGYMVDKAVEKLKNNGIDSAIVNAGGDIYCLGKNRGKAWRVGIKNPYAKGIIEKQVIVNKAIATSGGYEQYFNIGNRKFSHLVDVKSGFPVENDVLSVSVIADSCVIADGLATAFSVMGKDKVEDFFDEQPYRVRSYIVIKDGEKKYIRVFGGIIKNEENNS